MAAMSTMPAVATMAPVHEEMHPNPDCQKHKRTRSAAKDMDAVFIAEQDRGDD